MKNTLTLISQIILALIGIVALILMIKLPLTEGRAAYLDLLSIYTDPLITHAYIASIPFFIGLYQACVLLGCIRQNKLFSPSSVKALKVIKLCAVVTSFFVILAGVYIALFHAEGDDPAGFLALCIMIIFVSTIVAICANMFERKLQRALQR